MLYVLNYSKHHISIFLWLCYVFYMILLVLLFSFSFNAFIDKYLPLMLVYLKPDFSWFAALFSQSIALVRFRFTPHKSLGGFASKSISRHGYNASPARIPVDTAAKHMSLVDRWEQFVQYVIAPWYMPSWALLIWLGWNSTLSESSRIIVYVTVFMKFHRHNTLLYRNRGDAVSKVCTCAFLKCCGNKGFLLDFIRLSIART